MKTGSVTPSYSALLEHLFLCREFLWSFLYCHFKHLREKQYNQVLKGGVSIHWLATVCTQRCTDTVFLSLNGWRGCTTFWNALHELLFPFLSVYSALWCLSVLLCSGGPQAVLSLWISLKSQPCMSTNKMLPLLSSAASQPPAFFVSDW